MTQKLKSRNQARNEEVNWQLGARIAANEIATLDFDEKIIARVNFFEKSPNFFSNNDLNWVQFYEKAAFCVF